jgi:hypothetical protein
LSPGPLSTSNPEDLHGTLKKATSIIADYVNLFAMEVKDNWLLGDAPGGYLCTNNAVRTLLLILKHMCQHLERVTEVPCYSLDASDLLSNLKPLCDPLLAFFKSATPSDFKQFRNQQGGLKGITDQAMMMMQHISRARNDFSPPGLKEFIDSQDVEGTREARDLIDDVQRRLFQYVFAKLKKEMGEDEGGWWAQGVPQPVRETCVKLLEGDPERKRKEQYITLIDYYSIIGHNWQFFENEMAFTKDGGKDKKLSWIKDLNKIRNKTHHVEKWPLTKDEVSLVKEIHKKLFERLTMS